MSEAPERIWLFPLLGGNVCDFTMWTDTQASFAENSPRTEYTRADLSAAREAAARREGWNAAMEAAANRMERGGLHTIADRVAAIRALKEAE